MMDDDERLLSCQREIFRLRTVVRCMYEKETQYEQALVQEAEKESENRAGLLRALDLWKKIVEDTE